MEKSRKLSLNEGIYAMAVKFYQGTGGYALGLQWSGPGIEKQAIPAAAFYALKKELPKE